MVASCQVGVLMTVFVIVTVFGNRYLEGGCVLYAPSLNSYDWVSLGQL